MKSLKNHFSVIFPLLVLLFAFQFTRGLEVVVADYETRMIDEYTILVVAKNSLNASSLLERNKEIASVEEVSPKVVLDKLKGDISTQNLSLLQLALPKFYSIKLSFFPSENQRAHIESKLSKIEDVKRVETFSKTYNQIYKLLSIAKSLAYVFTAIIVIIALLLMLKQMHIWVLEHQERMEIMTLFGAPFWMKSAALYRLAIVDSLVATVLVVGFFWLIPNQSYMLEMAQDVDLVMPIIDPLREGGLLLGISLFFALISVSLVMLKVKSERN